MYIVMNLEKNRVRGFDVGGKLVVFRPGGRVKVSSEKLKALYDNSRFLQLVLIGGLDIHEIEEEKSVSKVQKELKEPKQEKVGR